MQRSIFLLMSVALFALSCSRPRAERAPPQGSAQPASATTAPPSTLPALEARAIAPARRKIIRNADLSVAADDPARAQQQAIGVVERLGGFALSTDAVSAGHELDGTELRINLVLRLPAHAFEAALGQLLTLGRRVSHEQVTGQDVTEEFIDLDARIATQRALESQLLEILKSTKTVSEMMDVHARLADVRGEIEKMDGRRRFLDDQTSLSTIRLEIRESASAERRGFGDSVRSAKDDVVAVASGIVTGGIRVIGALLPVFVMIVLPGYAIARAILRRRRSH